MATGSFDSNTPGQPAVMAAATGSGQAYGVWGKTDGGSTREMWLLGMPIFSATWAWGRPRGLRRSASGCPSMRA